MRWLSIALVALLVMLQYRLWFADNNWRDVKRLQQAVAEEQLSINERLERNDALQARVEDLKSGSDAVEELARSQLGLVASDEIFFVISTEAISE